MGSPGHAKSSLFVKLSPLFREVFPLMLLSHVQLCVTPWTVACQAPLSMEFSRQEYRSGLSFPSPGDLPNPGIEPWSPALQADSLPCEPPGKLDPLKVASNLVPPYEKQYF